MAPDTTPDSSSQGYDKYDQAHQAHDWALLEERLAFASAHAAGEVEGIFGPESVSWRLLREAAGLASGPSALLLQLAHPAIAAGVAQHSDVRQNPLDRARRTFYLMYQLIFGDRTTALGAARRLHHMHQLIAGQIEAGCGPRWAGQRYRASQPELQLWVWATLVRSAVVGHEELIGPLTVDDKAAHYAETKLAAALFGIPAALVPATLADFDAYFAGMLASDNLEVGDTARAIAHDLCNASYARLTKWDELLTAAFLPPDWRAAYGLRWTAREHKRYGRLRAVLRRTVPRLHPALRYVPAYHQAALRVALARGERATRTARLINRLDRRVDLPLSIPPVPDSPAH